MRIDSTHKPWAIAALVVCLVSVAGYVLYARWTGETASGSTVPGLIFGIAGYGFMLYSALLGVRRKFPIRRVGRASTWMRGHLWLGFLSLPILLLHAGFTVKGTLTAWLIALLFLTVGTGMLGALLQHYLPTLMTRLAPLETIYEEIPQIRRQLEREAGEAVSPLFAPVSGSPAFAWGAHSPHGRSSTAAEVEHDRLAHFRQAYELVIRPFLRDPDGCRTAGSSHEEMKTLFASLRTHAPASALPAIAELESICEEQHQLKRQKLIYRFLHSWLLVHVPLSIALLVLGAIHAVMALWY